MRAWRSRWRRPDTPAVTASGLCLENQVPFGMDMEATMALVVESQPPPTLQVQEPGMGAKERLDLALDHLQQHPPGALAQRGHQRVVRDARS